MGDNRVLKILSDVKSIDDKVLGCKQIVIDLLDAFQSEIEDDSNYRTLDEFIGSYIYKAGLIMDILDYAYPALKNDWDVLHEFYNILKKYKYE